MKTYQVTTKSRAEISAAFAQVFKEIVPASRKKRVTAAERMAPYRNEILKLRRRGLSWKQIALGMRHPAINEKPAPQTLKALFGDKVIRRTGDINAVQPRTEADVQNGITAKQ